MVVNARFNVNTGSPLQSVSTANIMRNAQNVGDFNPGMDGYEAGIKEQQSMIDREQAQQKLSHDNEIKAFDEMLRNPQQAPTIAKQYGVDYTPELESVFKNPAVAAKMIDGAKIASSIGIDNVDTANVFVKRYVESGGDANAAQESIKGMKLESEDKALFRQRERLLSASAYNRYAPPDADGNRVLLDRNGAPVTRGAGAGHVIAVDKDGNPTAVKLSGYEPNTVDKLMTTQEMLNYPAVATKLKQSLADMQIGLSRGAEKFQEVLGEIKAIRDGNAPASDTNAGRPHAPLPGSSAQPVATPSTPESQQTQEEPLPPLDGLSDVPAKAAPVAQPAAPQINTKPVTTPHTLGSRLNPTGRIAGASSNPYGSTPKASVDPNIILQYLGD
jgi:hypothetical protein